MGHLRIRRRCTDRRSICVGQRPFVCKGGEACNVISRGLGPISFAPDPSTLKLTDQSFPSPSPTGNMSNPTPEFVMEAQGIAFNFVQLRITVASLEEFSLYNPRYDEIAFQVEHMQSAFQEQVRQFKTTVAPDKTIQMPQMAKSQKFAFELDGTPAA